MSGNKIIDSMFSIKLIKNSKKPTTEWKKENREKAMKSGKRNFNTNNYGIITGKLNNITVVDFDAYKLDWLTLDQHPIYKVFNGVDGEDFNTFTVKTPSGGYHFYFKYEPEIKQTQSEIEVDIRSDGGFITAPNSSINGKKYKIIKNIEIKKMSDKLKEFLLEHLYTKKQRTRATRKPNGEIITYNDDLLYKYKNITEEDLRHIFDNLPSKYFTNYNEWLIFTTGCKYINCFDLWEEYSSKNGGSKYNSTKNIEMWNGINKQNEVPAFEILVNESLMADKTNKTKFILSYCKYAEIKQDEINFNKTIESEKLGYTFINENLNNDILLIKSDTGTGKTTSFKHYIKDSEYNFLSIVSRVSLGYEQYRTFNEHGAECSFYKLKSKLKNDENIVITIDSILKLWDFDFSNYVVYLDEVSSIIEYLITSDTLNNTRILIYNKFFEILNKCKYIIGTDADLDFITVRFFDFVGRNKTIIKNTYKHNKDIKSIEISNETTLIKKVKECEKYFICCDSKKNAEALYNLLDDKEILLITSDYEDEIILDDHKKIIISPKVIYGLDSVMRRPVFCYYKEHTINPRHMVQQITRCRNIDTLYYCFTKKNLVQLDYYSIDELKERLIAVNEYGVKIFGSMVNDIVFKQYLEILSYIQFNKDCYSTNKFAHFLNIIEERGFIVDKKRVKTIQNEVRQQIKIDNKDKLEAFKFEDYQTSPIQQILRLDEETANKYKELYIVPHKLQQHFNFIRYFNKDIEYTKDSVANMNDFILKKVYNTKSRIYFLNMLKNAVDCPKDKIETKKDLENPDYYEKTYKLLFRSRDKTLDFKNNYHIRKIIVKISKSIFGDCVASKKIRLENGTTEYKYNYTKKSFEKHNEIYSFRQKNKNKIDVDFMEVEDITGFTINGECQECEKELKLNRFECCSNCWDNVKNCYEI